MIVRHRKTAATAVRSGAVAGTLAAGCLVLPCRAAETESPTPAQVSIRQDIELYSARCLKPSDIECAFRDLFKQVDRRLQEVGRVGAACRAASKPACARLYQLTKTISLFEETSKACAAGDRKSCKMSQELGGRNDKFEIAFVALDQLDDQALLAKVARDEDQSIQARTMALSKLTDQTKLAEMVDDPKVAVSFRLRVISRLEDETLLAKSAMRSAREQANTPNTVGDLVRASAISRLNANNPILQQLAQIQDPNASAIAFDARVSIARVKLAMQEGPIQRRLPDVRAKITVTETFRQFGIGPGGGNVSGEKIQIDLEQGSNKLGKSAWSTKFPPSLPSWWVSRSALLAAEVRLKDLFDPLLHLSCFTSVDLDELADSRIPEVSEAAISNLKDRGVLAKIAARTSAGSVAHQAAVKRLSEIGQ